MTRSRFRKVKVAKPQDVMLQVQELKSMDFEQLAVYLQARNSGRTHDDAVDAVLEFSGVPL